MREWSRESGKIGNVGEKQGKWELSKDRVVGVGLGGGNEE